MRVLLAGCLLLLGQVPVHALQNALAPAQPKSVTVPAAIDHNRIVISVELQLPDGSRQTVRAWVDNGNPALYLSRRLAMALGLNVTCGEQECSAPPPREVVVGGMTIPLADVKAA